MRISEKSVAIIGCGLIGESWAALFLAHGLNVAAWDRDDSVRAEFSSRLGRPIGQLRALGHTGPFGELRVACTLKAAVEDAGWVQENVSENVALKQQLFAEIETATAPNLVIASSTSSLTWSELVTGLARPEQLITAHPFNPPHLMPLVEIYAGNAAVQARAVSFYRALGRAPITLKKDAVGHIANRLSSALWREAVNIVAEGIAGVSEVDAALVHGPGLRWSVIGSHMAYHLGGGEGGLKHYLRHLGPSQERRWATLGHPKLSDEVCAALVAGVEAEAAGRAVRDLEIERDEKLIAALGSRGAPDDLR